MALVASCSTPVLTFPREDKPDHSQFSSVRNWNLHYCMSKINESPAQSWGSGNWRSTWRPGFALMQRSQRFITISIFTIYPRAYHVRAWWWLLFGGYHRLFPLTLEWNTEELIVLSWNYKQTRDMFKGFVVTCFTFCLCINKAINQTFNIIYLCLFSATLYLMSLC